MLTWTTVTKLADTIVLLPAAIFCLVWLLTSGAKRLALWWCLLLFSGLSLVAITKIAFFGWGVGISSLDFIGISGHAMRASAIMPVLLYALVSNAPAYKRLAAIGAGIGFGVLISVSRIMVHAHSVSEVVSGFCLGAIVSAAFLWRLIHAMPVAPPRPAYAVSLLLLLLMPFFGAKPAPTERWLKYVAVTLSGHDKPYSREQLGFKESS
jgi:membrane-associated phospholipid phosphatase